MTEAEIEAGSAQMADAAADFLRSHREDRHDLLITHNFVIAWLVREALGAPEWRWLSIHQGNCGLTVLTQKSRKAGTDLLVVVDDENVGRRIH